MIRNVLVAIIFGLFLSIIGCKWFTEAESESVRWKLIGEEDYETPYSAHVNSDSTEMYVVTNRHFMKFVEGANEPIMKNDIDHFFSTGENSYCYVPYISDDYYFYLTSTGKEIYVGRTDTGEEVGSIKLHCLMDSVNVNSLFTRSVLNFNSLFINQDEYGKYMLSYYYNTGQRGYSKLLYGSIVESDTVRFEIEQKFDVTKSEPQNINYCVYTNFFLNGKYWQQTDSEFNAELLSIDVSSGNIEYLHASPIMCKMFNYNDYIIGSFSQYLKKSYDGGHTWVDWINHAGNGYSSWVKDKLVLHYGQFYRYIDIENEEIVSYDSKELEKSNIFEMIEFDGKVFALTSKGMFYTSIEECFDHETVRRHSW